MKITILISFYTAILCLLYSSCDLVEKKKLNNCSSYSIKDDLFLNYKIFQRKKSVDSLNLVNRDLDVLESTSLEDRQKKNANDYIVTFNEHKFYLFQEFTNDECSALVSIKLESLSDTWGSSDFNLLVESLMKKYTVLKKNNKLILFSNEKKIIELKNTEIATEPEYKVYGDRTVLIPGEIFVGYKISLTEKTHYLNQQIKETNDSIERRKNDSLKVLNRVKSLENL